MASAQDLFFQYAVAFEDTYKDDNWERLRQYFADDAVYEVVGGPLACRIEGVDAIFAGMKKSLDGMDRRADRRYIDVLGSPQLDGDTISLNWRVGYDVGEAPRGEFTGRAEATVRDGVIVTLRDIYDEDDIARFGEWAAEHAPDFDGSYL